MMPRKRTGIAIAEVLVASAIIVVLLIAFLNLYPGSFLAIHNADQRVQASALAQSIIETVRGSVSFTDLAAGTQTLPARSINGVSYQPTLEIFQVNEGDPQLMGLRATVTWTDRGKTLTAVKELWLDAVRR